jgi:hypothetical protein
VVLCLSQDGACTDSVENFREKSLKGDLSNDIILNPPLFSLVNTFNKLTCSLDRQKHKALYVSTEVTDYFLRHLSLQNISIPGLFLHGRFVGY